MTTAGFVACGFFLASCALLWAFNKWADRKAEQHLAPEPPKSPPRVQPGSAEGP